MAAPHQHRVWRLCRLYFRRFRLVVWLLTLGLVGGWLYVNQVGLPGFVKKPLLQELRQRGIELQFSRLRLRWYEGIVAENVRFGRPSEPQGAYLTIDEMQVRLNGRALLHRHLQVDSLRLHQGRLVWSPTPTNQPERQLVLDNIQSELRFLPNDQWALDNFKAGFAGAKLQLSGIVTNASAVRQWPFFQAAAAPPKSPHPSPWPGRLSQLAESLEHIEFAQPPQLHLALGGDARDLQSFHVRLFLVAPGATTPWGTFRQARLGAQLFAASTNQPARAELRLEAEEAQTPWASTRGLDLKLELASALDPEEPLQGRLSLLAAQAHTQWLSATNARLSGHWLHALTNLVPLSGQARFDCQELHSRWGRAQSLALSGQFAQPTAADSLQAPQPSWGWWSNLQPYLLTWQCRLAQVQIPRLQAEEVSAEGSWRAPQVLITNLHARLGSGQLNARGQLDVASRRLEASLASVLEPRRLGPLLGQGFEQWLQQLSWQSPPELKAQAALVLPAWDNPKPDWLLEVLPTVRLAGEFNLPQGASFRQVALSSLSTHFNYSNACWRLPDLAIRRPEGRLQAQFETCPQSGQFSGQLTSSLDPLVLHSLFGEKVQPVFKLFSFSQPPALRACIRGLWQQPEKLSVTGHLAVTNFTFRGQAFNSLQSSLAYSNLQLQAFGPSAQLPNQQYGRAEGLQIDLASQRIFLTNAVGRTEPLLVGRLIGKHIVRILEPYQFSGPVEAQVHGIIPLHGEEQADLYFQVQGGPFHWWKFTLPHISGLVHWQGQSLSLTNIQADFYDGHAAAWAAFDFTPPRGTDFRFSAEVSNSVLQFLMADLSTRTNHLEGRLNVTLAVTQANTEDWQSVFGYGQLKLRDGLIWDIPLFGILTPMLNGLSPGLGHSRASAATCSFYITNGVTRTEDLEIRSAAVRLQYRGTVDFEERVHARVEAEMLRDMPLVGPVLSTVFLPVTKLFEYRVEGSLDEPKVEPTSLIPKLLQMPFHPFRTLKGLLPEDASSRSNSAPASK